MKRNLLFTLFMAVSLMTLGQKKLPSGSYAFKESILSNFSQQKSFDRTIDSMAIVKNHKVSVIKADSNFVYYQYWRFTDDSIRAELNGNKNEKIFVLPIVDFNQLTKPVYKRYKGARVGAYTVPFRLRGIGDDFDFESSLSLSANMIFGFGSYYNQESWFDASLGIGLTKVNLTAKNTKNTVPQNRTASAFTLSVGGVFKPAPKINGGVFIGWDFLSADDRDVNWIYNGKMWVGLGINISLNDVETDSNQIKSTNKKNK
ncbi:hypothetical protein [Maribellus sediminis]|uniref:hypothetical protein n=1 Tax=Maribellus sediminis TaxID=2696285 RepID=UPI0014303351|nr:hypothetical protein [Maribellus sediminis]